MGALSGVRVLVVEDDEDARDMICATLAAEGAVTTCHSATGPALEAIRRDPPDVLVSDIALPGEDGHDFIRKVRRLPARRGGRTPAVALTGRASREDREESRFSGYHYHLAKPVEPARLVAVLVGLVRLTRR